MQGLKITCHWGITRGTSGRGEAEDPSMAQQRSASLPAEQNRVPHCAVPVGGRSIAVSGDPAQTRDCPQAIPDSVMTDRARSSLSRFRIPELF